MLNSFMEQLWRDLGYTEPLLPKDDGSYSLELEPNLEISLRENGESGITLLAYLASLPTGDAEEFFIKTMSANLFGKETGGGLLGIDQEEKQVTFTYNVPPEASYKDFYDAIEDFVNYADVWRSDIVAFGRKE